jgi:hypothetical protein
VDARRGRLGTVCARGAPPAWPSGPSTSPLGDKPLAIRRNVQEQNDVTRQTIRRTAEAFHRDMLRYPWLLSELTERGLDPTKGILAQLKYLPDQAGDLYTGYWLSEDRRFYRFEVLVAREPRLSVKVEQWRDATPDLIVKARQLGTGKSFGFIALEVLDERAT